jgi:UDP-N-acetylmuramyl pentapeptide phosphotransferase/UDP-N-acetylglucosamine-1-phosphate transferase
MSFIQALQDISSLPAIEAAAWGCATCFLISVLLVLTKKLHGSATMDMSHGVQKFHTAPTPRVGGLPIVIGLSVAWLTSTTEIKHILTPHIDSWHASFSVWFSRRRYKESGCIG